MPRSVPRGAQRRAQSSPWTRAKNWLFCLALLCLSLLICYWLLGLNLVANEWERKLRMIKKRGMTPEAYDEQVSVEEIAFLPDTPTRDQLIGMKLFRAIVHDDVHTVEQVLQRYGQKHVLASVPFFKEPLTSAALLFNRLDILKVLAGHRLDRRGTADGLSLLDHAVRFGYVAAAEWFLEMGVQSLMHVMEHSKDTPTPLHLAASFGNRQMVEMLLAKGPWGVNAVGVGNNWTPLHSLAAGGVRKVRAHYEAFNELVVWHKPKNPPTTMSESTYDPKGTAEALITAGADWNITGQLPLYR